MKSDIFLIEDHDEALKVWKGKKIKNLDLIHLDAHMDFGFPAALPVEKAVNEATSVKDLKRKLEYSLAFSHYETDFGKQTDIGNFIYPAMEEKIVNDFYWVIPGRLKDFKNSKRAVRKALKEICGQAGNGSIAFDEKPEGAISVQCLGRRFIVCILDSLPVLTGKVLLDIDTDFLVIDNITNADSTKNIGTRSPWMKPADLVRILKEKVKAPEVVTIAYSVNGGWTPMRYKYLGDELAYCFDPLRFKKRFEINRKAAGCFDLFNAGAGKKYYTEAARLNPSYRLADNNFGPLYLLSRKPRLAKEEFERVLSVDRTNPASLLGMGMCEINKRAFGMAKRYLDSALFFAGKNKLFYLIKKRILLESGRVEYRLKNFNTAKRLLLSYRKMRPLESLSYYLLGRIFEKEKRFNEAALSYKDAVRLGFEGTDPLIRLSGLALRVKEKDAIIEFISVKVREFKKNIGKRSSGLKAKLSILEKRMAYLR